MNTINTKALLSSSELRGAVTGVTRARGKEKPRLIQLILVSALAEVLKSGNHSEFTRLACGLPKSERAAVIIWAERNTWLRWQDGKMPRFFKDDRNKNNKTIEEAAADDWYAPIAAEKAEKAIAKKAEAEKAEAEKAEAEKAEAEAEKAEKAEHPNVLASIASCDDGELLIEWKAAIDARLNALLATELKIAA